MDKPSGPTEIAAQAATDVKPAASLSVDELRTQLEAERTERTKLERAVGGLRSLQDRRDQEYRKALAGLTNRTASDGNGMDYSYEEPAAHPNRQEPDSQAWLQSLEERQGLIQFKLENPDWKDYWDDIEEAYRDPNRAAMIGAYVPGTQRVDVYKTLQNAKTQAEVIRLRKSQAEAAKAREGNAQDRASIKAKAAISGVGAGMETEDVDVDSISIEEAYKRGLVQVDENNPPSFLRHKKK